MFWNDNESLSREKIREIQLERLKWQVNYAYDHVPFYKEKWDAIGLKPSHIQTLKDIEKIPFTLKSDLRDNYPNKMFAVDNSKIVRIHASSGTTGKPIVVGYTRNDMENWTECCARMATAAGVTNNDTAQISFDENGKLVSTEIRNTVTGATLMLNAPVPATRKVLDRAGMTLDDIDLFEVNEAFAVVAEKFMRDLDLDRDKVNVNGGAMALGHPIGATGAMLIGTVLDELERTDGQFGLITMCAGGGMAPAIVIERI